ISELWKTKPRLLQSETIFSIRLSSVFDIFLFNYPVSVRRESGIIYQPSIKRCFINSDIQISKIVVPSQSCVVYNNRNGINLRQRRDKGDNKRDLLAGSCDPCSPRNIAYIPDYFFG